MKPWVPGSRQRGARICRLVQLHLVLPQLQRVRVHCPRLWLRGTKRPRRLFQPALGVSSGPSLAQRVQLRIASEGALMRTRADPYVCTSSLAGILYARLRPVVSADHGCGADAQCS